MVRPKGVLENLVGTVSTNLQFLNYYKIDTWNILGLKLANDVFISGELGSLILHREVT